MSRVVAVPSEESDGALTHERLHKAAKSGLTCEVVLVLRGQILPPLRSGRGRWRLRTADGQTTFAPDAVLAVTTDRQTG